MKGIWSQSLFFCRPAPREPRGPSPWNFSVPRVTNPFKLLFPNVLITHSQVHAMRPETIGICPCRLIAPDRDIETQDKDPWPRAKAPGPEFSGSFGVLSRSCRKDPRFHLCFHHPSPIIFDGATADRRDFGVPLLPVSMETETLRHHFILSRGFKPFHRRDNPWPPDTDHIPRV